MRPDDEEMLENLRQVAERRRIDHDDVFLRGSRRHLKTVQVVHPRQAVSEPALRRQLTGGCAWHGTKPASNLALFAAPPPAARVAPTLWAGKRARPRNTEV